MYLFFPGRPLCRSTCPHCYSPQAVIVLSDGLRLRQSEGFPLGPGDLLHLVCVLLDLVVQHQHKGTAHASDHIGPGTLEEGF